MRRNCVQDVDHGRACLGIEVVQLRDVAPRGKVRIAPAGHQRSARLAKIVGSKPAVVVRSEHVSIGMRLDPGMVEGGMVRNEVHHQPQSARMEGLPRGVESVPSAHAFIGHIRRYAVWGARHVVRPPAGQHAVVLCAQLRVRLRKLTSERTALPHTHQVDEIETLRGQAVPHGIRDAAERDDPAGLAGQALQPGPCGDFEQVRMASKRHAGLRYGKIVDSSPVFFQLVVSSMISVHGVSMRYGSKVLFDDVNATFSPGRRYGLTGPNGAGKSTFMKLLTGELPPQQGTIVRPDKLGVLKQDQYAFDQFRVVDTVIMGNHRLWAALQEREKLYEKAEMSDEDGMRLGELEGIVGEEDGYSAESDAAILLQGLDIADELHERTMSELQGGQKVRVLLAQALFGHPMALLDRKS